MRKFAYMMGIALVVAVAISLASRPMAVEERMIRVQAAEAYPEYAEQLEREPLEVQAVLLDYRHDDLLRLKAEAALLEFPELIREILPRYGTEPEFQAVLREYGSVILPPIHYFLHHDVHTLALRDAAARQLQSVRAATRHWWQNGTSTSTPQRVVENPDGDVSMTLTPEQRGWHAVDLIAEEGHGFLGQFTLGADGEVKWIQSERLLEAANSLFAGGIRQLESRVRRGQEVEAEDIGWALADGAVMVSAVKLLRMGRASARSARAADATRRNTALASHFSVAAGLVNVGRYAQWPTVLAGTYLVVRHPAIVSDALAAVARTLGYPVRLVQFLGWTLILLPCLYLGLGLLRLVVPLAIHVLHGVSWLERKSRRGGERYLFR
ncbi:hypothetical protein [Litchfieldella qijiaojingensis]|nr:hypothetical protein [Halomonas qijiaojingensis]